MHDQSNNDEKQSIEMNAYTLKSPSSKQNHARQKFSRFQDSFSKQRNNVTISMKNRRRLLSKALAGNGDSLINIQAYKHHLMSMKSKHDIITINVSGNRYETRLSTLENYPNTLLGNKKKREYYWNEEKDEYYFDRHRACFEAILYYYQSNGRLRRPDYVPLDTFLEEVSFFDLGQHAISQINKLENVSIVKYIDLPNQRWRRYIWFYLEYPQHSTCARIIQFMSMILTVLSCVELAVETLPEYDYESNNFCEGEQNKTLSATDKSTCSQLYSSPFFIIQTICVSYFTIEFMLRLISTPSYWRFILSILNWIDLCAIVPYFVLLGLDLNGKETGLNENSLIGLRIFRVLRFVRVCKIYLIFKQLKSLRVLGSTLKESFLDFIIMIAMLTLLAFLFGAAIYFAEQDTNGQVFDSIPRATYWGILTITAVGYGDMYPVTVIGRILACSCALFGIATCGILVSVLVDRYQRVYNRKQFFPEHILSAAVDSSTSEHDEKQDFIDRKLSGTKKSLLSASILPRTLTPAIISPTNHGKYLGRDTLSSNVRFVITLIDDTTNNRSMRLIANELMEELIEIVKNRDEQIHFKLISTDVDSSNGEIPTRNRLCSISEDDLVTVSIHHRASCP